MVKFLFIFHDIKYVLFLPIRLVIKINTQLIFLSKKIITPFVQ